MDVLEYLYKVLSWPVVRLFEPADALFVGYLFMGIVFATLSYIISHDARRRVSLRRYIRFILPKRVLLHRSSLLDYRLFVVNSILMFTVLGVFIAGAPYWMTLTLKMLTAAFGPGTAGGTPSTGIFLLTMALQLIALDSGYWLCHWAFHNSPVLWEFHKVHHSAEVMTPATEWRQHPVELVLFPIVYGITSGVTFAGVTYWFGPEAHAMGLTGQNMILVLHLATFHHLRHSHVYIPFTGIWGRLLHSPAHHHIHHSTDPAHFNKNLGYLFSVWDWMFGTLVIPNRTAKIEFGLGEEGHAHTSLRAVYVTPMVKAWAQLRGQP